MFLSNFPPDKAVFTTTHVMKLGRPILHVIMDEEGDLQVFSNDFGNEDSAMLVSFEQIVKIDATVLRIVEIKQNQVYSRKSPRDDWYLNHDF